MSPKLKVLFVCLGNICRSPIAHAVMLNKVAQLGLTHLVEIDSKGTSKFHLGNPPDSRCLEVLRRHNIELNHTAKQISAADLEYYDYILVMDHLNHEDVVAFASNHIMTQKVMLLRSFEANNQTDFNVPDPYYSTVQEFEEVFEICSRAIDGFIEFLVAQHQLDINLNFTPHADGIKQIANKL